MTNSPYSVLTQAGLADRLGVPRSTPVPRLLAIAGAMWEQRAERILELARTERDRTALVQLRQEAHLSRTDPRTLAEKRDALQAELEQQRVTRRATFRQTGRYA